MSRVPHLPFYSDPNWKARASLQLRFHPRCACGCVAVIADHARPHRGDRLDFELGDLVSRCAACFMTRVGERAANHDRRKPAGWREESTGLA